MSLPDFLDTPMVRVSLETPRLHFQQFLSEYTGKFGAAAQRVIDEEMKSFDLEKHLRDGAREAIRHQADRVLESLVRAAIETAEQRLGLEKLRERLHKQFMAEYGRAMGWSEEP